MVALVNGNSDTLCASQLQVVIVRSVWHVYPDHDIDFFELRSDITAVNLPDPTWPMLSIVPNNTRCHWNEMVSLV